MISEADILSGLRVAHVGGGTVALFAGAAALVVAKGGRLHRTTGKVFVIAMLVMAVFADILAVLIPGQLSNFLGGTLAAYLVLTAWMTLEPSTRRIRVGEIATLSLVALLAAPLTLISFDLVFGLPLFFTSATPIDGDVRVAIAVFTSVVLLATALDLRQVRARRLGAGRLGRHVWRVMAGLALNAGSAFTNGLPRLLPKALHPPAALQLAPMVLVLALLAFWMVRIQWARWTPQTRSSGKHPIATASSNISVLPPVR